MDTTDRLEPLEEILAAAETGAGFRPTDKQRKDWRRTGIIPGPMDRRGLGREHGSVTLYPAGTGDLLTAVCRHCKPKKPLPQLAFAVWWDGYTLPDPALVTSMLHQTLDDWERLTLPWVSLNAVPPEERANLDRALATRLPVPLRIVRDRVGKTPFRSIVTTLLNVAAGGFEGFRPYPPADANEVHDDVRAGLGIDKAAWITRGLSDVLPELSTMLNPEKLRVILKDSPFSDLEQARDETRDLITVIETVSRLAWVDGSVGKPFVHLDNAPLSSGNRAMIMLWWLSARRRPAARRMRRDLLPIIQELTEVLDRFKAISATDMKKPPRAVERSGGTTQGRYSPCTTILASPYPPPDRDMASSS